MVLSLLNSAAFQYDENSSFGQFAVSSPAIASGYLNSKIAVVLIIYGSALLTEIIYITQQNEEFIKR